MDQLAALRGHIDQRAVYDAEEHASLINTAKYADLHDLLWQVLFPKEHRQAQNARLDFAARCLLRTKNVFDAWLGCDTYEIDVGTGNKYMWHICKWFHNHSSQIDWFAAEGTTPCGHVMTHHTFRTTPKSMSSLRNLHRLKDAVTLAAYWTIMQDYETLGCLLMKQRLRKAISSQVVIIEELGLLGDLPIACLNNVVDCIDHLHQQA